MKSATATAAASKMRDERQQGLQPPHADGPSASSVFDAASPDPEVDEPAETRGNQIVAGPQPPSPLSPAVSAVSPATPPPPGNPGAAAAFLGTAAVGTSGGRNERRSTTPWGGQRWCPLDLGHRERAGRAGLVAAAAVERAAGAVFALAALRYENDPAVDAICRGDGGKGGGGGRGGGLPHGTREFGVGQHLEQRRQQRS